MLLWWSPWTDSIPFLVPATRAPARNIALPPPHETRCRAPGPVQILRPTAIGPSLDRCYIAGYVPSTFMANKDARLISCEFRRYACYILRVRSPHLLVELDVHARVISLFLGPLYLRACDQRDVDFFFLCVRVQLSCNFLFFLLCV